MTNRASGNSLFESNLARAILLAVDSPTDMAELRAGRVPAAVISAAASLSAARVQARRVVAMTPALDGYRGAVLELQAELGRSPTVAEVGRHMGRSNTAAHVALTRLRKLGTYPEGVEGAPRATGLL